MQNKKLPIRKIVSYLNNEEAEGGGFWLPNIQRPFVWSEDQIARLFDSIMREYPISTLLVWKTKEAVKHRRFIDLYHKDVRLSEYYVPDHKRSKLMVLDGQQRLQSLFIGLKGSYTGKELCFDVLSGESVAPEDIRYRFEFKSSAEIAWPWVRFKDLVFHNRLDVEVALEIEATAPEPLNEKDKHKLQINVNRARREFASDDNITYQELDGIDNPDAYKVDDIVEIFIRANSGGTKLGKSDLLFSLLTSSWEEADSEMEELLENLNQGGFCFDRDFVLKSCLTVLNKGAQYSVKKFRDGTTKDEIVANWERIADAIKAVRDWVVKSTYIRSDKGMPSYLALLPLIYFRYWFPSKWSAAFGMQEYLLRTLITGAFGGARDNLHDKLVREIKESQEFDQSAIYGIIRAEGQSLDVTPETIIGESYGSRGLHLLFNLWYKDFDYKPALDGNGPQVDHVFPQSMLKTVKSLNADGARRNKLQFGREQRDQIANCMLLTADENGFQGKNDTPPVEWFALERFPNSQAQRDYLKMHLIPNDPQLWELECFEQFISERKKMILNKFSFMLIKPQADD